MNFERKGWNRKEKCEMKHRSKNGRETVYSKRENCERGEMKIACEILQNKREREKERKRE